MADDGLDRYRAIATVAEMPIGLSTDDVAALPGAGRLVFASKPAPGALQVNLFRDGFRRLLNTYVAGMHAGYGLAALADPKTFLLAARRLADALYGNAAHVIDASESNAAFRRAIDAVYPDATWSDDAAPADGTVAFDAESPSLAGPPIFVVGCPRSGTTWLQTMLLCHPGLAGPHEETAMFSSIKDLLANDALLAHAGRDGVVDAVRDFASTLFAHAIAETPDARLVEKTPHHALHLDIIEALYPDACVIAIHRDGREVVRSLLEVPFGTPDPGRAARGWVESTTAVERFRPHTLRLRDVKYEALRDDPVAAIADLLEWVGLDVDDHVREALRDRATRRVSEHNQRALALDPAAMNAVIRYAGDQLVHLGYLEAWELAKVRKSARYRVNVAAADAVKVAKQNVGKLRRLRKN